MKKQFKLTLLFIIVFSAIMIAQEKINKVNEDSLKSKLNSTQATNDQILFKNETGNSILTITDEGNNAGSITLPPLSSIASSSGKLYNFGGSLYWNGSALGSSGSAGGWTKNGTNVYLSNLTDYVGIGTSTPSNHLEIRTSSVSSAARLNLGNLDDSHHLFLYSGKDENPNPMIGWQDGDALRFTKFDGSTTTELIRISSNGNVGIGSDNPMSLLSIGGNGFEEASIFGLTSLANGCGVRGEAINTGNVDHYGGYFTASDGNGIGIYGQGNQYGGSFKGYYGVKGTTYRGIGVFGYAYSDEDYEKYGGFFTAEGGSARGLAGIAWMNGDYTNYGGYFESQGNTGYGVYALSYGYEGIAVYGRAMIAEPYTNYGGYFQAEGFSGCGMHGEGFYGLEGISNITNGVGIYGQARDGYAGYFDGKVYISGLLEKPAGSFKIDHPLDPTNKNLYHSFVESPDMMNIYNGNVITDANGYAQIQLPEWFEALNKDFRYQLTVIGEFAQAIVSEKISHNQFSIKTDNPNVEVSWQVTGIRQDAYANKNRILVEEYKNENQRGKYLHPEAFNMPKTFSVDYNERRESVQDRIEQQKVKLQEEHRRMEQVRIKNEE